jgi:hypothetical protein
MCRLVGREGKQIMIRCVPVERAFLVLLVISLGRVGACLSYAQSTQQAQIASPSPDQPLATRLWDRASITAGYTYLYASQGTYYINLSGCFAKPSFTIGKGWSAFADFTSYYGANQKGSLNSHGFTFGGQKGFFPRAKIRPSLFAEAGDLRVSNVTVTNSFIANFGGNLQIPFANHLALAITPAEYILIKPPGEAVRNDFNSKVGLSLQF